MHPHIAPLPAGGLAAIPHGASGPFLALPDNDWNHGQGFRVGDPNESNVGGWHSLDNGLGVELADIHSTHTIGSSSTGLWTSRVWSINAPGYPNPGPHTVRCFSGYLRPPQKALVNHPVTNQPWVDSAAFEVFAPVGDLQPGQQVVIAIRCFATLGFPKDAAEKSFRLPQTYLGFFSPDGLMRSEKPNDWAGNTDRGFPTGQPSDEFLPGRLSPTTIANNTDPNLYIVEGYIVPQSMGRPTELNHQRHMQLLQAIKIMLGDLTLSPLKPEGVPLTDLQGDQVEDATVVFLGGSNGSMQAQWAGLLNPDLIHGVFGSGNHPSVQRQIGEQELAYSVSFLSGFEKISSGYEPNDPLNWLQFAWARDLSIHDLSLPRNWARGRTYRPFLLFVGDEDITSTGTDWVSLFAPSWVPSGAVSGNPSWPDSDIGWMVADKTCHDGGESIVPFRSPPGPEPYLNRAAKDLIAKAVANRQAQTAAPPMPGLTQGIPHALVHEPLVAGEELRGVDDPYEWYMGRDGSVLPPADNGGPLLRDDAWSANLQPGAAGTWLGFRDSMLVANGAVFVGGAEGVVSKFVVANAATADDGALTRVAQSRALGDQAWSLVVSGNDLLVGTRRHIHRLDAQLNVTQTVQLPWEQGKPYRMRLGKVLPGHAGLELVFASWQGGIVILDPSSLALLHEFHEPGVTDLILGPEQHSLSLLSERGVVAQVSFVGSNGSWSQELRAVSDPQQGRPRDLERAELRFGMGTGSGADLTVLASLWDGDQSGLSLRIFDQNTHQFVGTLPGIGSNGAVPLPGKGGAVDLEPIRFSVGSEFGDHVVVLEGDRLRLINEVAVEVGSISLVNTAGPVGSPMVPVSHPMAIGAIDIAVGELSPLEGTGGYTDEIVVATKSGRLVWLHANELLPARQGANGPVLDSTKHALDFSLGAVQKRTNESMSATWPMALKPGDNRLHVLEQNGSYWAIDGAGQKQLRFADITAAEAGRSMVFVGSQPTTVISQMQFPLNEPRVQFVLPVTVNGVTARGVLKDVWEPGKDHVRLAFLQKSTAQVQVDWVRERPPTLLLDEFAVFRKGGDAIPISATQFDAYCWSDGIKWTNQLEGLRIDAAAITGQWASTSWPTNLGPGGQTGTGVDFHHLCAVDANHYMDLQALKVIEVAGQTHLVLGMPGGGVSILKPGDMRTDALTAHDPGTFLWESPDLGHGSCALAVRVDDTVTPEVVHIAVGAFGSNVDGLGYSGGGIGAPAPLTDLQVMSSHIWYFTWSPGSSGLALQNVVDLRPDSATLVGPRGGFGVCGLAFGDVLDPAGEELIATTMAGDLFVYSGLPSLTLQYRTNVHGSLGMYDSIRVADLDGDSESEIYLAGSMGIQRFVRR